MDQKHFLWTYDAHTNYGDAVIAAQRYVVLIVFTKTDSITSENMEIDLTPECSHVLSLFVEILISFYK